MSFQHKTVCSCAAKILHSPYSGGKLLPNQDILKLIFGIKLRGLRLDKGLSLKDLSRQTGLSPSYINEIEKGKKYPKSEKIACLAKALDEKTEDLTSLELKRDLQIVQNLLDKKILTGIPFDLFGIPSSTIFELLSERPQKMQSFAGTIIEIARAYNIKVDDFLFALLRSYVNMHDNYFPALEAGAREVTLNFKINWAAPALELKEKLITILKGYGVSVIETQLQEINKDLAEINYFITKSKSFYISSKLNLKEQNHILAREIGYQHFKFKDRKTNSLTINFDSFSVLLNDFSATYFANSLLIPEDVIIADLKNFFAQPDWNKELFFTISNKYAGPIDNFFHRMTQILPKHFGIKQLFFLRNIHCRTIKRSEIVHELHLAKQHAPHRTFANENSCSLWLVHRMAKLHLALGEPMVDVQRSYFTGTNHQYLVIGATLQREHTPEIIDSLCIGIDINENLKLKIPWYDSKEIKGFNIGETCERCISVCPERQAPLLPKYDLEKYDRLYQALERLN